MTENHLVSYFCLQSDFTSLIENTLVRHRTKRQTVVIPSKTGTSRTSELDADTIVRLHNDRRKEETNAANMRIMVTSNYL